MLHLSSSSRRLRGIRVGRVGSPKPTSPRVPTRGRVCNSFLGSIAVTACCSSVSSTPTLSYSPICFPYFCVVHFIIVRMILFITKFLIYPTIQKTDRHLVIGNYSDAMKPYEFMGVNFKRWQMRAQMWLSAMGVFGVVSNPPALRLGSNKELQEFTAAMTVFIGCVLSVRSN